MKTVLMVEDNITDRRLLERVLVRGIEGFRVMWVGDGEQAVAYLSGDDRFADREAYPVPNLVLLDLKMPRMSGFELLSWIRESSPVRRMPVVVLSSSRERQDVNRAYECGANSYVSKDSDPDAYTESVQMLKHYWLKTNELPEVSKDGE